MRKHYFRLLGIMLCALLCSNAFAEKLAYGFCVNNIFAEEEITPYLCTIDVEGTGKIATSKIQDYTEGTPLSGIYAEKDYYLLSKVSGKNGLYKVDIKASTPTYTTIAAEIKSDGKYTAIIAITYDPIAKVMYATTGAALYTLNLDDGTATKVADIATFTKCNSIACSAKGELYGYDWFKTKVFSINKTTGATNEIVTLELEDDALNSTSLFFDYETDKLYCFNSDYSKTRLVEIDLETNTVSKTTATQMGDAFVGLSFIQKVNITPDDPVGVRTTYGINYAETGATFIKFDANAAAGDITPVGDYSFNGTPQGGVNVNGVYYIIAKGTDDKFHLFKSTDVTTGNFEQVSTEEDAVIEPVIRDMAYDAYTKTTYAISDGQNEEDGSLLYIVNLTTGKLEGLPGAPGVDPAPRICAHRYYNLTALTSGQLYGITTDKQLSKLINASGQRVAVGAVDWGTAEILTNYPQDLEFDPSTWTLYWSYRTKEGDNVKSYFAIIDPSTAQITKKTEFKDNATIAGLYFPEKAAEPTATWFGYCYSNDNRLADERAEKKESFVTFDPANLASISLLPTDLGNLWCGAQGENGALYSFDYSGGGLASVKPASFSVIDVKTWNKTKLFDVESDSPMMADMTYDFSSSTFYFISFDIDGDGNYGSSLYSLNIINGEPQWKKIIKLQKQYAGIACNLQGELYGLNMDGELCKLNKITGSEQVYMAIPTLIADPEMTASLEFDHNNEMLYLSYYSKSILQGSTRTKPNAYLAKIDLDGKEVTQTIFPGRDKVVALYIPFERNPNIPGKVTEFTIEPALYGTLRADLTWTNPTTTLGGEPLTKITSIDIIRNGELIFTVTKPADLEPGAEVDYTDKKSTNGFNNYIISVINEEGAGMGSSQLAFIGEDTPIAPLDIKLTVENGTTATLTWKAPNIGINTGFVNQYSLTYKVVRQPDNVVVAGEASIYPYYTFTETIDALNYYYYEVTAIGAQGTSEVGKSNSAVIGTAMVVPYECDFLSDAELGLWTLDSEWKIGTMGLGDDYKGIVHAYNKDKANCWAYSPAISLEKDKSYELTFDARSLLGPTWKESMKVCAGLDKTVEAQSIQIIDLPEVEGGNGSKENPTGLINYKASFTAPADGHYYLGFYCYSEDKGELQVTNITLDKIGENSIDSNVTNGIRIYSTDGKVRIEGEYTSATVYDQMGVARSIDATLTTGVYFVKVMNGNTAKTYKVLVK